MANINKCYIIHLNLDDVPNLDLFIQKIVSMGIITFCDDGVAIWLNDDVEKEDLTKCLKKLKISEFFCKQMEYGDINKEDTFNFISSWFMENYNAYLMREEEKRNKQELIQMYENIQKAQQLLDDKIKQGQKSLEDKNKT